MTLKQQLTEDMKTAMRGGDKHRLGVIRLVLAAIKQREVDERIELDDAQTLAVLEKMLKQRRDSVSQYASAGREDLADVERAEMAIIETYLPAQLDEAELDALIASAIADTGASSPRDMGKVMAAVKEKAAGRADMAQVSVRIKAKLAG
ncbi:MAG: glutamyl-tRNA amidotransferase [Rhodanobacter sp. 68-29]|uniref:GatB/YqeY domain-containing protein n=1 Tax=Rhodanobacter sp. PCA2 TaxID=2006117 RepID=UPI00086CA771|nr:GatB/YqeY domain-containing protein [Rhodanobacter sp. PCA2]MBA2079662.1 glutamyl-tRNA amidotransferase [Rhodanobacter sp. PCA2]MBN8923616.1 GatB/YqeY domain-containing protein [Rhodanobacter sp.]ODU75508.1 MAG: glutamyl-tRNA amidotransferase [Rhodanobacter sp. SCN 69-32]OJY56795.1 MAG: glutamyl-tRNA amidotransferase [Rhodanobacter sp. 68-29]